MTDDVDGEAAPAWTPEGRRITVGTIAEGASVRVFTRGLTPRAAVEELVDDLDRDVDRGVVEDAVTHVEAATVHVLEGLLDRLEAEADR